ncbi:MAG: serine hydrolase domain-containing protein [Trebonia sp.]
MSRTLSRQVSRRAVIARWLAVTAAGSAAAAFAVMAVPGTAGTAAAAQSPLPPLNSQALAQAIAGLPSSQQAAAVVKVTGRSGSWSGASGLADLASGGPAAAADETRVGSISKTFIATVVLQLAAQHRVSLDQPVQQYLPGLLRPNDPPVTTAELLDHTSGLGPADGTVNTGDPQWFLANRLGTYTAGQLLGPVLQQPLVFPPGTRQQYNGVNYIVLAMLIQKVTGHGYAQEIEQRILRPLGLDHTYIPAASPAMPGPYLHGYYQQGAGQPLADISAQSPTLFGAQGAMISTVGDLDQFITALFRGRLLPSSELNDMFTIPAAASGTIRYGMGLLAYTLPNGVTVWGHTGETPGYASGVFATRNLARALAYAITPVGPASGSQVLAAELRIAQAAYDPPPAAG